MSAILLLIVVASKVFADELPDAHGAICTEDGPEAHPGKCNYYYDCWGGVANLGRCPMSMLFNKDKLYCDYPKNVNCGSRKIIGATETENECPHTWGLVPNMEDCSSYYHCSRGRKINMARCHDGLMFDQNQLTCNWPEKVDCRGAKKPPPMFTCPHDDGYFANPKDCHKLFLCYKGQARMLGCSAGQAYDSNLQRCIPNIQGCLRNQADNVIKETRRRGDDKPRDPERRLERRPSEDRRVDGRKSVARINHREHSQRIRL